eukprot:Pgem_evm1s17161
MTDSRSLSVQIKKTKNKHQTIEQNSDNEITLLLSKKQHGIVIEELKLIVEFFFLELVRTKEEEGKKRTELKNEHNKIKPKCHWVIELDYIKLNGVEVAFEDLVIE